MSTSRAREPAGWTLIVAGHPMSPKRRAAATRRARLRDKRSYREAAAWQSRQLYRGRPLERARVVVTLYRNNGQPYDPANAIGVCKHLLDGLCVQQGGRCSRATHRTMGCWRSARSGRAGAVWWLRCGL